jgi:hypothetical protein
LVQDLDENKIELWSRKIIHTPQSLNSQEHFGVMKALYFVKGIVYMNKKGKSFRKLSSKRKECQKKSESVRNRRDFSRIANCI